MAGYPSFTGPNGRPLYHPLTGYEGGRRLSRETTYSEAQRSGLAPPPLHLTTKPPRDYGTAPKEESQPQGHRTHRRQQANREGGYFGNLSAILPSESSSVAGDDNSMFGSEPYAPYPYPTQIQPQVNTAPRLRRAGKSIPYKYNEELYDGLPDPEARGIYEREIKPLFYPPASNPSGSGNQSFNTQSSEEVHLGSLASEYRASHNAASSNPTSLDSQGQNISSVNPAPGDELVGNHANVTRYSDSFYSASGDVTLDHEISQLGCGRPGSFGASTILYEDTGSDVGLVSASRSDSFPSAEDETHMDKAWNSAKRGGRRPRPTSMRLDFDVLGVGSPFRSREDSPEPNVKPVHAAYEAPMLAAAFISSDVPVAASSYPQMEGSDWRALQVAGDVLTKQGLGEEFREFLSRTNLPGRSAEVMAIVERRAVEGAAAKSPFMPKTPTTPAGSNSPQIIRTPPNYVPDAPNLIPGSDHIPVVVAAAREAERKGKAKKRAFSGPGGGVADGKKRAFLTRIFSLKKEKEELDGSMI